MVMSFLFKQNRILRAKKTYTNLNTKVDLVEIEDLADSDKLKKTHLFAVCPNRDAIVVKKIIMDKVFYDVPENYFVEEYKKYNAFLNSVIIKFGLFFMIPFLILVPTVSTLFIGDKLNLISGKFNWTLFLSSFTVAILVCFVIARWFVLLSVNRAGKTIVRKNYQTMSIDELTREIIILDRLLEFLIQDAELHFQVRKVYKNRVINTRLTLKEMIIEKERGDN